MSDYPYKPIEIDWKRPPIDRQVLKKCTKRSDVKGLFHALGVLAIIGASGAFAYYMFLTQQWVWLAAALYLHGGLFAFTPQTHELSHGTVFRSKWLNQLFKRIYGLVNWPGNSALYKMSHTNHHLYTVHSQSDGEVKLPMPEMPQQVLHQVFQIIDIRGLVTTLFDVIYFFFVPFLRNPRRTVWQRYVYSQAKRRDQRDLFWTQLTQALFHVAFGAVAIATGNWFLIVVVSLPAYYGGRWYHMWVHDTMHSGREPEADDFRRSCRTVRLDPFTSFMYWHMEWHAEHHAFAAIPCYNLRKFHKLTKEHWDPPQTLIEAWREMNQSSKKVLVLTPSEAAGT
ncbi:MAG: hypothetical protein HN368_01750 [Spirochaetales bacterium]|nr:hypothetical protein [Spirochaetales bacterium]